MGAPAFSQSDSLSPGGRLLKEGIADYNKAHYKEAEQKLLAAKPMLFNQGDYEGYVKAIVQLSIVHRASNSPERAMAMAKLAIEEGQRYLGEPHPMLGKAYYCYANELDETGERSDVQKVPQYLDKALSNLANSNYHHTILKCYQEYAMHFNGAREYQKSLEMIDKAFGAAEHLEKNVNKEKGLLYKLKMFTDGTFGNYDASIKAGKQATDLLSSSLSESSIYADTLELATCLMFTGVGLVGKGDAKESIKFFEQAIEAFSSLSKGQVLIRIGYSLYNISLAYALLNDRDKSIEYGLAAEQEFSKSNSIHFAALRHSNLIPLARRYIEKGNFEAGYHMASLSLEIAEQYELSKAVSFILLGEYHSKLGDHTESLVHFRAAKRDIESYQGYHEGLYHNTSQLLYTKMNSAFLQIGAYDSAAHYAQLAVVELSDTYSDTDPLSNPDPSIDFKDINVLVNLLNKGKSLQKIAHNDRDRSRPYAKAAFETFLVANQIIDQFRADYLSVGSKFALSEKALPIFEASMRASLDLLDETSLPAFGRHAFALAEKSKAMTLLESRWESIAKGKTPIPAHLLEEERQLEIDLAYHTGVVLREESKGTAGNAELLAYSRDMVFETEAAIQAWDEEVSTHYPSYLIQKNRRFEIVPAQVIDSLLQAREALIEYFLGDDELITFVISQNGLKVYRKPIPADFHRQIADFSSSITSHDFIHDSVAANFAQFTRSASHLYQFLLAEPLQEHPFLRKLIIVPDGPLNQIPFEALLSSSVPSSKVDFSHLPYLITDYQIRYGFSAALLLEANRNKVIAAQNGCIAFAPGYGKQANSNTRGNMELLRSGSSALPGAQHEVQAISKLGLPGQFFFGEAATESHFKLLAEDYRILHLALHGQADPESPSQSRLIFEPSPGDTCEDQSLYAYEIQALPLKADLAVLSACESGTGKVLPGEGVMSLARNFMASGAKSVVSTLWEVEDEASARLMEGFYLQLQNKASTSQSLHNAKRDFLAQADSRTAHPFYWASYVANGDSHPFGKKNSTEFYWCLVVASVLGFAVAGIAKTREKAA